MLPILMRWTALEKRPWKNNSFSCINCSFYLHQFKDDLLLLILAQEKPISIRSPQNSSRLKQFPYGIFDETCIRL